MSTNKNLHYSKANVNDEYYTKYEDIEKQVNQFAKHFKNKVVYCNCDNPFESNFFKFFVINFNRLKLKKLVATHFVLGAGYNWGLNDNIKQPNKAIVTKVNLPESTSPETLNINDIFKIEGNTIEELKGNGDFRSEESIETLIESDIVVSNPPFSLFREYIDQLVKYDKKFLVIGNAIIVIAVNILPLVFEKKLYLFPHRGVFICPNKVTGEIEYKHVNSSWYSNLGDLKRKKLEFTKSYNEQDYPKYTNYDAIEVGSLADIPCDYYEKMGVPVTFLGVIDYNEFELIPYYSHKMIYRKDNRDYEAFSRLIVKRKPKSE